MTLIFCLAHISWSQTDQSSACLLQPNVTEEQTCFFLLNGKLSLCGFISLTMTKAFAAAHLLLCKLFVCCLILLIY